MVSARGKIRRAGQSVRKWKEKRSSSLITTKRSLTRVGDSLGAIEGLADGLAEGLKEGLADGSADGLADGLGVGLADGLKEGLADGLSDGDAEVISDGVAVALPALEGWDVGVVAR